ncbi:MAG: DNRLRE domain-containing protein [Verrucomicrobia bacterium]|nr:DNRLRE domain-containing protein [Verrucomicrobiota bacterium]
MATLARFSLPSRADEVTLNSVADTTLISTVPNNNLGGQPFFNAGITQNRTTNRAVLRFDLTGQIPPGSTILSADLLLEVTRQPKDGYSPASFDLHRLLQPWGEGDKTFDSSRSPGLGQPTATNEATWIYRFAFTTNTWTIPGGAATNDFLPFPSTSQAVFDVGSSPYQFPSTAQMVADVQAWLDHPDFNFGWLLKESSEDTPFTARRFGSREDPNTAPRLVIEFTTLFRIQHVAKSGGEFTLSFAGQAGKTYSILFRDVATAGAWTTLTNFTAAADANVSFTNTTSAAQRFYRVSEQ